MKTAVMGESGEDIILSPAARDLIPYSFECKNQERLNIWSSLDQAEENCNDRVPIVVIKRNRSEVAFISSTLYKYEMNEYSFIHQHYTNERVNGGELIKF